MVKCKFCQSEISEKATVCPVCKRNLNPANNPLLLIPIFILIGLFFYFIFSSNAPWEIRKIVCTFGIRDDYPYCYEFRPIQFQ